MDKFSIIIPTLWKTDNIYKMLSVFLNSIYVDEIILIDNDYSKNRKIDNRIIHIKNTENLYVNPSWNLGVEISKNNLLCIINDDIYIDENSFDIILSKYKQEYGLIGIGKECYVLDKNENIRFERTECIKRNFNYEFLGFGCMLLLNKENYKPIPNKLKIAYGDNWLIKHFDVIHKLLGVSIKMAPKLSTTVESDIKFLSITENDKKEWLKIINTPSICLNMIVKNESHIIENTLNNILDHFYISYWVISDTGSTDNTVQIIEDFFNKHKIKGELYKDEWQDFGHNRTVSIKRAINKADYILIFDADDKIIGDIELPNELGNKSFNLKFDKYHNYFRPLLLKGNINWKWNGVLHEFLSSEDSDYNNFENINGDYYIESGKSGSRSNNKLKYLDDAIILRDAYYDAQKQNDDIYIRYSFYCAQSYRDAGDKNAAIKWYLKRTELGGWIEEVYYSYLMIGTLYLELNNIQNAMYYFMLSQNVLNTRAEGYYYMIQYYRHEKMYNIAYDLLKIAKNIKKPKDGLFVYNDVYDFLLDFELSIVCYYVNKKEEGLAACKAVIENGKPEWVDIAYKNTNFYE